MLKDPQTWGRPLSGAEYFGTALIKDGKINVGGTEIPFDVPDSETAVRPIYVRRFTDTNDIAEIHHALHQGLEMESMSWLDLEPDPISEDQEPIDVGCGC